MSDPDTKKCGACVHTKDQHDEDGFCEIEEGGETFCKCPGYVDPDASDQRAKEEPEPPPEGTGGEGAD